MLIKKSLFYAIKPHNADSLKKKKRFCFRTIAVFCFPSKVSKLTEAKIPHSNKSVTKQLQHELEHYCQNYVRPKTE